MSITAVENPVVIATSRPSGLTEAVCLGQPTGARQLARTLPVASRVPGLDEDCEDRSLAGGGAPLQDRDHPFAGPDGKLGVTDDDQLAGIDAGDPRRTDLRAAEPLAGW